MILITLNLHHNNTYLQCGLSSIKLHNYYKQQAWNPNLNTAARINLFIETIAKNGKLSEFKVNANRLIPNQCVFFDKKM